MKSFFSMTRALVARKRKIFALFFALAASIGLSWGAANSITINGTPQVGDNSISLTYYFDPGNVPGFNKNLAPTLKVKCVTDNNWDEKWLSAIEISSGTENITLNTLGSFKAGKEYAICFAYNNGNWVDEVFQSFSFPAAPDPTSGSCGDNLTWEFNTETGALTISGTGAMNDYSWDPNAAPWYAYKDAITSVSFPEGITTIGAYAFVSCDNAAFTKVTIPEGVTALGVNAFYNCDGIQEITIPSTVTTIQTGAIYDCKAVNSITSYIASPTNLHGYAIYGYKSTCTLYVPYNSIAAYQAADCWKNIPNIAAIPGTLTPESVAALIDAIGEVAYTAECKAKIDAARAAYDDLSTEDKALVDAAKLTALTTAEANFTTAKTEAVNAVKTAIDALPALPLTDATKKLSEYNKVKDARAAYDALLNADDKALVTNLTKLEAVEAAYAAISGGTPAGALSGKFSIDESSVVYFSKGNLQATTTDNGTNWTWSFAANQWNTIGNAVANTAISGNGKVSENGTVDLFGWSTTTTYYGIHNSTSEYDYEGDFVDWGATMGAGWRTLTCDEWNHLLFNRTMQSSAIRYARSTVNGIQGMIIVPDDWDEAYYTLADSYDFDNIISAADWTDKLEAHGAVFLPVTGFRSGTSWQPDDGGHYSTPTPYTKYSGFIENMNFNGSGVASSGVMGVSDGLSVRLVTAGAASPLADALAAKDLIDAIPSPVVYTPECGAAIKAAREALDALSDEAKAFFAKADTAALPAAEATYAELLAAAQEKADAVVAKIDAIPATIEFTEACGNAIEAAREAYDALTDAEKALVPAEKLTVLTDAEVAYERAAPTTDLSTLTADYEVRDGKTLIGTLANNVKITIAPGATVTLSNVNINGDNTWTAGDYAGITCPGDATIILADGTVNKIRGFMDGNAALHIKPGYTLTIEGNGTLYASTNGGGSAIGCGYSDKSGSRDGGNVVINGGTIYATGGGLGSGIGGGGRAKIGDITINGGIIFATGGGTGAGIGGGQSKNSGWKSECGNITISSSVKYLNATKGSGAEHSVGKGSSAYSVCGTLSVGGNTTELISTSPYIYCPPADAVEVLIDAIGTLAYTPECKARIDAARAAYDALEIQEMKEAVENYATLTAAEEAYASATDEIALINAIPNPVEFTDACKEAIDAARAAYDAMTEAGKALVTNYATLTAAESKYAVDKTKALINALPDTPLADEDKKLSEYNKVTDAREAYDALTDEEKAAVDNYDKLTAAEAAFAAIGGGGGVPTVVVIYKSEFTSTGVTKEGVNLALSNGSMTADDMLAMDGSFEFSTSLGKFTNITIETDVNIMNISEGAYTSAGWPTGTNLGTSAAWTGNSESVLIDCMVAGNAITITCTVAPASVIADAQAAKDLIDAIPSPVVYTPECKEAIKAAREALDALSDEAKALFNEADTAALPAAETAYAGLLAEKVAPVIAAIDAVPATPLTDATKKLSEYNKVTDARALYDALATDEEKAAVTNYDKLTAAEAAFAAIDKGAGTIYDSGSVALTGLKIGDVLKGGVTLIGEAADNIGARRVALNGEKKEGLFYILPFEHMNPLLGENAAISHGPNVFSPIAEDGNAGDAWIVTDGSNQATVWLRGISTAALPSIFADAQAAVDLINAIPAPVVLSDECKAKIDAAREAVTALGENASLIDDADIDKLAKAEADFALLIKDATAVVAKIDAIGDVTFSAECKEKIVDARNAYEALADELKPYVTNLTKLTDAEAAYEAARPFAPVTTVPAAVEALQYTGATQTLITAGAVEHGTILYSLDGVDYSTELPTALLPGAYTVYYKVQATDDYKDVAPATFTATIAYNYPATYSLFGIPEGWSVKVNGTEATVENGAVKNIAKDDKFDVLPVKPEDVKLVEVVPYILDLATATDSVIYLMNGDSITGTANGHITVVIVPDAKVYFKDVNLTNTGSHPAVLCGGNAEMVVVGENSITCTKEGEYGIRAAGAGTTLTISGDKAQLSATIDPNGGTVNQ